MEVNFASDQAKGEKMTEAELQDSLFRFANNFSAEVHNGTKILDESSDPNIRGQVLLRRLIYNSAALDIALGPSPQANLLDMIAFIELCRGVWNNYWMPKVFSDQGSAMSQNFKKASDEVWSIASRVMTSDQKKQLANLIQRWKDKNPGQISVENVRFSQFSKESGARAQEMQSGVGGLLAGIKGATRAADQAVLLGERALFYAQRAPFLWRAQAQAGTREVLTEAMTTLASSQSILDQQPQIHALLQDISNTFGSLAQSMDKAGQHPKLLPAVSSTFVHLAEVLHEWNRTLSNPHYQGTLAQFPALSEALDRRTSRILWKAFALGASLIVLFGAVTLGTRLVYLQLSRRIIEKSREKLRARVSTHQGRRAA
jgi:hypothetical protein